MSEFREHYAPAALYQATGLEPVLEAFLANSSAPTREWASQVGRKGKDPESLYEGSSLGFARTFLWAICVYLTGANRSPTKPPVFPTASSTATPLYNPTVNPQQPPSPPPPPPPGSLLSGDGRARPHSWTAGLVEGAVLSGTAAFGRHIYSAFDL